MDNKQMMKETVYSPASDIRSPLTILKETIQDGWASRGLAYRFARRNISAQYRQSLLGILWAFIPVIMTASIWIFLNGEKVVNIEMTDVPYPVFVFVGMTLWQGFTEMLNAPIGAVQSNKALLTKINFPKESLLLSGFLEKLFSFSIKLLLLIVIMIVFGVIPGAGVVWAPIGIIMLFLLGQTIGLWLLPIAMLYKDVQRALTAIVGVWMFLTPVIYPEPKGTIGKIVGQYNPVGPLLSTTRSWITGGVPTNLEGFCVISGIVIVMFFLGLILFRVALPHLIARIGS